MSVSPCPNCCAPIGSAATIQCDGCKKQIHVGCTDISGDLATRLTRSKSKFIRIYCSQCCSLEERCDKLLAMVDGLRADLDNRFKNLELRMAETPTAQGNQFEDIVSEAAERIKRSGNVLIRGIPETASTGGHPSNDDTAKVMQLIEAVQGPDHVVPPISVKRVGKSIGGKPRTLIATFNCPEDARKILRNKKRLANIESFKNTFISDDMTPRQLKHLQDMRLQLKQRIESGEGNITIKYIKGVPRIVSLLPKNGNQ